VVSKMDNAFAFQEKALGLRAHRQQILAGNIANADTPHYKARDFDFKTALNEAVAGRSNGGVQMATTAKGHLPGNGDTGPARLMYRTPSQASVDGNTVDMDIERGQFSENAVQYEAGITFISHLIKMQMAATQG
jgi:flagellar basal-body rod protein FlgB